MKAEAKAGVVPLPAKECQGVPRTDDCAQVGDIKEELPGACRGSMALPTR